MLLANGAPCGRGSSPLARGTPDIQHGAHDVSRFIPAGAGNTTLPPVFHIRFPVHPRWRGEHHLSSSRCASATGSSPLARGTHPVAGVKCTPCRFIPAGAGNTRSSAPGRAGRSVHPRWRGEHQYSPNNARNQNGSSPLARGTPGQWPVQAAAWRFIPAGAGNTQCRRCR